MTIDAQQARSTVSAELARLSLNGRPVETHIFEDEATFYVPVTWAYESPLPPGLPIFLVDKGTGKVNVTAYNPLLPIGARIKEMTRIELT